MFIEIQMALVQQGFKTYTVLNLITFPTQSLETKLKPTNVCISTFYGFLYEHSLCSFLCKQS